MQFAFTDEQNLIRESVGTACEQLCGREDLFKAMEDNGGFHTAAWQTLCAEMGLGLTAVPEARGGLGLGTIELASIMEKMGRTLLPTPFFTSIILSATALIHGRQTETFDNILSGVGSGDKIASFAFLDTQGHGSAASGRAIYKDGSISADLGFVQYATLADYLIILAQNPAGTPCLVVIETTSDGIEITPRVSMDMTRPMSDVSLKDVSVINGEPLTSSPDIIDRIFNIARICLASEQLGASEAVLEKTQAYALERHQFGRAIGSFQAVKHRLADMMVLNEAAKSAAWYAACAADEMPEDLPVAAATAMVVTSRALKRNSKNMIQLHGGMGFTWECEAHLYLKRAELSSRYLGAETIHRETLAAYALGELQMGETS